MISRMNWSKIGLAVVFALALGGCTQVDAGNLGVVTKWGN